MSGVVLDLLHILAFLVSQETLLRAHEIGAEHAYFQEGLDDHQRIPEDEGPDREREESVESGVLSTAALPSVLDAVFSVAVFDVDRRQYLALLLLVLKGLGMNERFGAEEDLELVVENESPDERGAEQVEQHGAAAHDNPG